MNFYTRLHKACRWYCFLSLIGMTFPLFSVFSQDGSPSDGDPSDGGGAAQVVPQVAPHIAPQSGRTAWYVSNAAGLALYPAPSRLVALRGEYCLGMAVIAAASLPPELLPYYQSAYIIDCRTLYQRGKPFRIQWIFRDGAGKSRLVAAASLESGKPALAFIERYGENGLLLEERDFSAEADAAVLYFYADGLLVRSETRVKTPVAPVDASGGADADDGSAAASGETDAAEQTPAAEPAPREWRQTAYWADRYYYTRSNSLREVRRAIYEGETPNAVVVFPGLRPRPEFDAAFVQTEPAYNSDFLTETLAASPPADSVVYETGSRGEVLSEKRYDADGLLTSELKNNWTRGRISSVEWRGFDDEGVVTETRITEYEYGADNTRVFERDFVNGTLERTVRTDGGREIEELYLNGAPVLRTMWENGRKVREERIRK